MSSLPSESKATLVVGIDLGTTNSVLAWADIGDGASALEIRVLGIPQVVELGALEERPILASALLLSRDEEMTSSAFRLPWQGEAPGIVGAFAARRANDAPDAVVLSAKSWLCQKRVNREGAILPWVGDDHEAPQRRISPVEAQAAILAHLRRAFDFKMAAMQAERPIETRETICLDQMDVVLTVPASFDPEARELTLRAAERAGLGNLRLLEEPQAAVYAWLASRGEDWRHDLGPGDLLLVCDVGGGTTDLSLVAVRDEQGALELERVAVGEHLLLGGDNIDLALAHHLRGRLALEGNRLDGWQFRALVAACRDAKERLLGPDAPAELPIAILARGRRLVGGTLRLSLSREEVERIVLDGFLPELPLDAAIHVSGEDDLGLQEMGLPYERDPAITRHMLRFLRRHAEALAGHLPARVAGGALHPTAILFNGGAMRASALAGRVTEALAAWAQTAGLEPARVLAGADLAHACARGAAYYAAVRRGGGVRIRGGTARSFYVGVASAQPAVPGQAPPTKALCVVPRGLEDGTRLSVPGSEIGLRVGGKARFRFFASATRPDDRAGWLLDEWDAASLDELSPLEIRFDDAGVDEEGRVAVGLEAHTTEVGTLELEFVERQGGESGRRWRLAFEVRERGGATS